MVLKKCPKCGKVLLEKHKDTDRIGKPVQWYRCLNGHWIEEAIEDERKP